MTEQSPNQAKVLTVSDSVEAGNRPDVSGNALVARLAEAGYEVIEHRVVSDDVEEITNALSYMAYGFNGLVVTTGGSGFGQRDFTPEATKRVLDRATPGMAEVMRQVRPRGRLSRADDGHTGLVADPQPRRRSGPRRGDARCGARRRARGPRPAGRRLRADRRPRSSRTSSTDPRNSPESGAGRFSDGRIRFDRPGVGA